MIKNKNEILQELKTKIWDFSETTNLIYPF